MRQVSDRPGLLSQVGAEHPLREKAGGAGGVQVLGVQTRSERAFPATFGTPLACEDVWWCSVPGAGPGPAPAGGRDLDRGRAPSLGAQLPEHARIALGLSHVRPETVQQQPQRWWAGVEPGSRRRAPPTS